MKDKILVSTKNIIKYINVNTYLIIDMFKKFFEKKSKKEKKEKIDKLSKKMMEKLAKNIMQTEFYAINNKWKKILDLKKDLRLLEKTFKFIKNNVNLNNKEQKITDTLLIYFHCVIELLQNCDDVTNSNSCDCYKTDDSNISTENSVSYDSDYSSDENECESHDHAEITAKITAKITPECKAYVNNMSKSNCHRDICDKLKITECIREMYKTLIVISTLLEKQFVDQINTANEHQKTTVVYQSDCDLSNKIMDMFYFQFKSIIDKYCGNIFNDNNLPIVIKIRCDGKEIILCEIQNIRIVKDTTDNISYIYLYVGNERFILQYVNKTNNYDDVSKICLRNITNIGLIVRTICSNEKLIDNCIDTTKNLLKYNHL